MYQPGVFFLACLSVFHVVQGCYLISDGCSTANCNAGKQGAYYGREPVNPGAAGIFNYELFIKPKAGGKGYYQYLGGPLLSSAAVANARACCLKCSTFDGCVYFQYYSGTIKPAPPAGYVPGDSCYLLGDAPMPYTPWHSVQISIKGSYTASTLGGYCKKIPAKPLIGDPHFVGARGTQFDFNGDVDKTYCLITDENLQVNALFRGYYDGRTDLAKELVDGKLIRTWMTEMGILWKQGGSVHTLRLIARPGKEQDRGAGLLAGIEIDGQAVEFIQEIGTTIVMPGGEIKFVAKERKGRFDVDRWTVKVDGLLSLDVWVRVTLPSLQTDDEAFAHFNLNVNLEHPSGNIHGLLGQTYRNDVTRNKRARRFQQLVNLLQRNIQADGESGKGFLDGKAGDYVTSSLLATDSKFSSF
eukprot:TRINITY_DN8_c0_g1_i3.p1 TRINITY_DN8_c0_g1~~TRINITY_DN8_c0_g1_i3.p1  ORF type:complete len:413 (+),score=71.52 TRINITY_DN8_c0_g1_i3:40-1278(+)